MKKLLALLSLTLLTAAFSFAQITPINATLKAVDANGYAINTGITYTIVGVNVTPFNLDPTRLQRYIVDTGTGWGMMIDKSGGFATNPAYNLGDLMKVTGTISMYNGLMEFTPTDTTENLGSGYAVSTAMLPSIQGCTAFDASLALMSSGEYYESRLVRLNNVWISGGDAWPAAGNNANVNITDASGATIILRIDKETDVDGSTQPTGHFNLVGVVTQFDSTSPYHSGYQIIPTKIEDVTAVADWSVMAK